MMPYSTPVDIECHHVARATNQLACAGFKNSNHTANLKKYSNMRCYCLLLFILPHVIVPAIQIFVTDSCMFIISTSTAFIPNCSAVATFRPAILEASKYRNR